MAIMEQDQVCGRCATFRTQKAGTNETYPTVEENGETIAQGVCTFKDNEKHVFGLTLGLIKANSKPHTDYCFSVRQ